MWLLSSWVLLTKYWLNVIKKHQLNLQIFLTPGTDACILILELFTLQLAICIEWNLSLIYPQLTFIWLKT